MLGYLNGYLLLPLLEGLTKRSIAPKLKGLKEFEQLSNKNQLDQQKEDLYRLLVFCKEKIPYYTQLFREHRFDIEAVKKDIRFLEELPVLTKDIVRENAEQLKFSGSGPLHVRKTGGSTGQSVFFFYDNEGLDWTAAINLYAYEMAGKRPHHTDCHISADLEFGKPSLKNKLIDTVKMLAQNRKRLMISSFSDQELEKRFKELKSRRPYLLQGHPSSLYAIANFVERTKKKPIRLCHVFEPTGEMLTSKMVESIEKNVLCKVTNRYGNAEFGVVAHARKDDKFRKLKVFQKAFYVEECQRSNIIVTALTNYGFPLLRYDTGDIGSVTNEDDGCFIYDIEGRVHDIVEIGGDRFPSHYIMDFLDHQVRGIREFQIVLESEKLDPVLNIVLENENDKERIFQAILSRWPVGLEVRFVSYDSLVRLGWRQKFRHLIDLRNRDLNT